MEKPAGGTREEMDVSQHRMVVCGLIIGTTALVYAQEQVEIGPAIELTWSQVEAIDTGIIHYNPRPFIPPNPAGWNYPEVTPIEAPAPQPIWGGAPAPRSACPGGTAEPTLDISFQASPDSLSVIPPDTMGTVGPNHVMCQTNGYFRIYTRTGELLSSVDIRAFWYGISQSSPCDPHVVFDTLMGRWVAVAIECGSIPNNSQVYLAVSSSDDPLGTWRFWHFTADPTAATWADYPQVGVNSTWIAMTANMFPRTSGPPRGSKLWVVEKTSALVPGNLRVKIFSTGFDWYDGWKGFTMQPCMTFDAAEPALYLVDSNLLNQVPGVRISKISGEPNQPTWTPVDGPDPNNPNAGAPGVFVNGVPPFNTTGLASGGAEQMGESRKLEAIGARLLNAVFRNGRIWTTYDAALPAEPNTTIDSIGAAWIQIDPGAMPSPVVQSGTIYAGPHTYHIYPSIAVNCANDVVIGFTRTGLDRYPEAAYASRLAGDPLGTLRPVRQLKAGESPYYKTFGGGRNRWGDYSATSIDPRDDLTFWTVQEYAIRRSSNQGEYGKWGCWFGRLAVVHTGDCNCDGVIDNGDINAFVLALSDPAGYRARYPDCNLMNSDCNQDGRADFGDITPFVELLTQAGG